MMRRIPHEEVTIQRFAGPILFTLAVCYLAYHAFIGERGFYAYLKQSRNLESTTIELAQIQAEREQLENRVHRLSDKSLDLDLLDEQARRVLGMAKPTEAVIVPE